MEHSFLIDGLQQAFMHQDLSVHNRRFHIRTGGRIDNPRDRIYIIGREGMEIVQVEDRQIGFLPTSMLPI